MPAGQPLGNNPALVWALHHPLSDSQGGWDYFCTQGFCVLFCHQTAAVVTAITGQSQRTSEFEHHCSTALPFLCTFSMADPGWGRGRWDVRKKAGGEGEDQSLLSDWHAG